MRTVMETVEHPVPLGELYALMEDFRSMGAPPDAGVTFRRVGREASPVEVKCEWEGVLTLVPDGDESADPGN